MLEQAQTASDELKDAIATRSRRGPSSPLDDFSENELREIAEALDAAMASEQEAVAPGEELSKQDLAYVPRDATLSMLQTAIDVYVAEREPDLVEETTLPDGRRSATEDPVATDRVLRIAPLADTP